MIQKHQKIVNIYIHVDPANLPTHSLSWIGFNLFRVNQYFTVQGNGEEDQRKGLSGKRTKGKVSEITYFIYSYFLYHKIRLSVYKDYMFFFVEIHVENSSDEPTSIVRYLKFKIRLK